MKPIHKSVSRPHDFNYLFGSSDASCSTRLLDIFNCRRNMIQWRWYLKRKANLNVTGKCLRFRINNVRSSSHAATPLSNEVLNGFHQHHYTYNFAFYECIGDYEASGCLWKLTFMFRIRNFWLDFVHVNYFPIFSKAFLLVFTFSE